MAQRVECPHCKARASVPDGTEGRKVRCPRCGHSQRLARMEIASKPDRKLGADVSRGRKGSGVDALRRPSSGFRKRQAVASVLDAPVVAASADWSVLAPRRDPVAARYYVPQTLRVGAGPRPRAGVGLSVAAGLAPPVRPMDQPSRRRAAVAWVAEGNRSRPATASPTGENPVPIFHAPPPSWWNRLRNWYSDTFPGVTPAAWRCLRRLDRIVLACRLAVIVSLPVMTKATLAMIENGADVTSLLFLGGAWAGVTATLLLLAASLQSARAGLVAAFEVTGFNRMGATMGCREEQPVGEPALPWT